MSSIIVKRISADLQESRIDLVLALAFIPIAFFTFLFHETGHWLFGELTGNRMTLSLNNSAPVNTYFVKESDALWSAIGGPLFTILQALIFMLVARITKSLIAWAFVFFAVFSRFFTILLGGFSLQDEFRIAGMLHINEYLVAGIVLLALSIILYLSSRILRVSLKATGYFTSLGTLAMLLVILTNTLINN